MDADIDVTGEIEFFDGGVKFDVIWFRELIDVDIVDSSVFDIVWVDISWVEVGVFFDAGKFSLVDVTALILHFGHLKTWVILFKLSIIDYLEFFVCETCAFGVCPELAGITSDSIYFFPVCFPGFLTGILLRGWWFKQIEQIQAQSDFWHVSQ